MEIKVLGTGCPNCKKTKAVVAAAVSELGINAAVEEVTDLADIMAYGVMATPALVIDGVVVGSGGVPTKQQVEQLLRAAQAS
ncbi:MAG: TM0996/MTH895 family glutaredoxin-like protein [Caldilineaceae bacterium]|nr:TM0996/MTH895 family glutaredoxin-like protein [Caldilineaceae bacterium]MCB9162385.1 TM0996/MTH895 family glutaredoxin-like protein [Caldilineaceae bacterium]